VVVDEPTVGLDPRPQIELRRIIQSLGQDHTVLLCTHQLSEAETSCDRVGLIDRGSLVKVATTEELHEGGNLERLFLEVTGHEGAES
jgi:ABC-2 type transport system ATP-binding protein